MILSAGTPATNKGNNHSIESIIAGSFLFCVVVMQILTGFSKAVRLSTGRVGRAVYHLAFAMTIVHDFFIALAVPASLLWVAAELLKGDREVEALLAAIVGTLWYGPERVQNAMTNLIHIPYRRQVLFAALSPYHRYRHGKKLQRQLRFLPWWAAREQEKLAHGKLFGQSGDTILISDEQLRSIARRGVRMALTGEADANEVRAWSASLVADQARFPHSLLQKTELSTCSEKVFSGHEGTLLRRSIEDISEEWTTYQWQALATVMKGVRSTGLTHLFRAGWVVHNRIPRISGDEKEDICDERHTIIDLDAVEKLELAFNFWDSFPIPSQSG